MFTDGLEGRPFLTNRVGRPAKRSGRSGRDSGGTDDDGDSKHVKLELFVIDERHPTLPSKRSIHYEKSHVISLGGRHINERCEGGQGEKKN